MTDEAALMSVIKDLSSRLEIAEAIIEQIYNTSFLEGTIYEAIRSAKDYCERKRSPDLSVVDPLHDSRNPNRGRSGGLRSPEATE